MSLGNTQTDGFFGHKLPALLIYNPLNGQTHFACIDIAAATHTHIHSVREVAGRAVDQYHG